MAFCIKLSLMLCVCIFVNSAVMCGKMALMFCLCLIDDIFVSGLLVVACFVFISIRLFLVEDVCIRLRCVCLI